MPSTHTHLLYHFIFATKNREPMISESFRARLHEYLGGCVTGFDGVSHGVGGVSDHVHLLVGLNPTHRVSDLMRDVKKASSTWVRQSIPMPGFAWQEGYAAFTVSASVQAAVQDYIRRQEQHHRRMTFREELVEFLEKSGVTYDGRFLD